MAYLPAPPDFQFVPSVISAPSTIDARVALSDINIFPRPLVALTAIAAPPAAAPQLNAKTVGYAF